MHYYWLLGTSRSLVAKGNRVPQLFPWATIFVVLVQGLQVRRQDQTSERHTYMLLVWKKLENLQRPLQTWSRTFSGLWDWRNVWCDICRCLEAWNHLNCSYDATFWSTALSFALFSLLYRRSDSTAVASSRSNAAKLMTSFCDLAITCWCHTDARMVRGEWSTGPCRHQTHSWMPKTRPFLHIFWW